MDDNSEEGKKLIEEQRQAQLKLDLEAYHKAHPDHLKELYPSIAAMLKAKKDNQIAPETDDGRSVLDALYPSMAKGGK